MEMPASYDFDAVSASSMGRPISVRGPAAVDRQGGPGDGLRRVAGEEDGEGADLAGPGEFPGRLVGQQHLLDDPVAGDAVRLGLVLDLLLDQRRPDVAGADGVGG